jgi:hypothetical protein
MENQEQQFTKGFNNGYLLAQHRPELLAKVTIGLDPANDYINGLLAGKKEYEKEKERITATPGKHEKGHQAQPTKDNNHNIDKDR